MKEVKKDSKPEKRNVENTTQVWIASARPISWPLFRSWPIFGNHCSNTYVQKCFPSYLLNANVCLPNVEEVAYTQTAVSKARG